MDNQENHDNKNGLSDEKEFYIFDVVINDKKYEVWQRKEKHHLGQLNGFPDNWWVRYPTREKTEWIPWIDRGTNRPSWEVNIKVQNSLRYKWDEYDISSCGIVEIKCNLRTVYKFFSRDLNHAFSEAQHTIFEMSGHPFDFSNPDKEVGRKIYYHNQPAIISSLYLEEGEIYMDYDGEGVFDVTNPWDGETDWPVSPWNGQKRIRDDIFSNRIYWFRK